MTLDETVENSNVHAWTVNDADSMQRTIDRGVDNIMTDDVRCL